MVSQIFSFAAITSILSVAHGHMVMKQPIPYGRGSINNSPLANDGSDYPCKNIFEMTDPTNDVNHLVPGVANTLSFTGSAVHGGGSCQVALTTDLKPTKSSKWMVIKSIENGCPANVGGNLPADPNGNGASTFQYTVPAGFPEGDYTISWIWFNKIGNREMYMNCGRAKIGNSKKRYALPAPKVEHRAADYPDILKAQLSIFSNCIDETFSVQYPNPGPDVERIPGGSMAAPHACGGAAVPLPANSGSSPSSGPVASSAPTLATQATTALSGGPTGGFASNSGGPPAQATTTRRGRRPAPSGNPGVFASGAASQSAEPTAVGPDAAAPDAQATATATVSPVPAAPSSGPSNGNGSSVPSNGASTQGSKCSEEGAWACSSDGKSFQRCASGIWSAPMQVAAGTTCSPGTSMNLSMKLVSGGFHKRDSKTHQHHKRMLGISS